MKKQSLKKLLAFIIALTILSAWPEFVSAQTLKKCNQRGKCPSGYHCYFGYCVRDCARCPGSLANEALFISSTNSNAISFLLTQTQNVSAKMYDATGRLIKTIANGRMSEGYHQIEWDSKDETGYTVQPGVYFLRMEVDNYTEAKKILIVK